MAAQLKEILKQTIPYYQQGAPLLLEAHAIYEDTATGQLIAQLKWRNISRLTVHAVNVILHCKDSFGATLEASTYQYMDVSAVPQGIFGTQNAIELISKRTRQCEVTITGVSFADGSIWSATREDTCKALPAGKFQTLSGALLSQFERDVADRGFSTAVKFTPQTYGDLWQCGCGSWQKQDDDTCTSCKATMTQLAELSEPVALAGRLAAYQQQLEDNRIAKEKADAEKKAKAEAERVEQEKRIEALRKEQAAAQKKAKIRNIFIVAVLAVALAAMLVFTQVIQPKQKYDNAVALMESGQYDEASAAFGALGQYSDAAERVCKIRYTQAETLLANGEYGDAVKAFFHVASYHDALKRGYQIAYEKTMQSTVAGGYGHTVGLRADSTVVAVGDNEYGECDVSGWTDNVAVAAGYHHTVGLRADGTVVAVGDNEHGERDVSGWTDIVAVAACSDHTVGLRADGTVVAVGNNESGECDVSGWADIVAVAAGCDHTVGLRKDGTVVAVGSNEFGECDVSGWTDIVAVAAGWGHTIGLRADGTLVARGSDGYGECDVSDWTDIVAVAAGYYHTVGLRADGTVVAVGYDYYGVCDVGGWTDIVAVAAGSSHTVGLRKDGTMVAVGGNISCNLSDWTNIGCNLTLQ